MRDKKNRARPAAFAAGANPDSPARGYETWPNGSRPGPGQEREPPETGSWPDAGAWPDGTRPRPGPRPEAEPWPEARQWPERGQWRPWQTSADRASMGYQAGQVTGPYDAVSFRPDSSECPTDSQIAGAPAAAGPRSAGRFDAEWCPKGARVRRNSLLRRRRRAGGGAMVRKATLDRGLRPEELAAAAEAVRGAPEPAELTERRSSQWRGSGGRWLVWAFRAVIWAVLLIVGFRGVEAIATGAKQPASGNGSAPATPISSGFPTGLAEAFALQFGNVYLNFSPATAAQRATDLTPFIPVGSDPEFGWNGAGSQQLQSEQIASISVQGTHRAIVTLLARVSTGLIELAVPVYSAQGGLVVSAEPALLPGPERANPPSAPSPANDPAAVAALTGQLPGFFRAYASGDQQTLGRFLAPGASVTGLGGAVTFGSISGMEVPAGGATRLIVVSVKWQLPGQPRTRLRGRQSARTSSVTTAPPGLQMTYEMTVVRQNGTWYVQAIGPSAQKPGGT